MKIKLLLLTILSISLLISCDDDESDFNTDTKVNFWLSLFYDKPGEITDEQATVTYDIKEFQYYLKSSANESWVTPEGFVPGEYATSLNNFEINSLLGQAHNINGEITKLRVIFGNNNYVVYPDGSKIDILLSDSLEIEWIYQIPADIIAGRPIALEINPRINYYWENKLNSEKQLTLDYIMLSNRTQASSRVFYHGSNDKTYWVKTEFLNSEWYKTYNSGGSGNRLDEPSLNKYSSINREGNWNIKFYDLDDYFNGKKIVLDEYNLFIEEGQSINLGNIENNIANK